MLILHIGTHKTGTTAIQRFMAQNAATLEQRFGLCYLSTGRPNHPTITHGHHLLAWASQSDPGYRDHERMFGTGDVWEPLASELQTRNARRHVVSSEEFDRLDEHDVSALADRLRDQDVRVIVYLRRQDQFVQAMYRTDVVYSAEARALDEYLQKPPTPLDYLALLGAWERAFGRERLIVRHYQRGSLAQGDVVRDFCQLLGIPAAALAEPAWLWPGTEVNRSQSTVLVELMLAARRAGLDNALQGTLREVLERLVTTDRSGAELLSPQGCRQLMLELEPSNRELFARYLPGHRFTWTAEPQELVGPRQHRWLAHHADPQAALHHVLKLLLETLKAAPP